MVWFNYILPLIIQVYSCGVSNIPLWGVNYLSCLRRNTRDQISEAVGLLKKKIHFILNYNEKTSKNLSFLEVFDYSYQWKLMGSGGLRGLQNRWLHNPQRQVRFLPLPVFCCRCGFVDRLVCCSIFDRCRKTRV